MERKEALKLLGIMAASPAVLKGCVGAGSEEGKVISQSNLVEVSKAYRAGRQEWELERLEEILEAPAFFTEHEMHTITVLGDIIIPADEVSGSASDANVPEFIGFIVKDMPHHQKPMREGLQWLDKQCKKQYGNTFVDCNEKEQIEIVETIAYPEKAGSKMQPGVEFFERMRNLTASGFYTTKMGIEDIGYEGNRANVWTGVPEDVLAKHDVEPFFK